MLSDYIVSVEGFVVLDCIERCFSFLVLFHLYKKGSAEYKEQQLGITALKKQFWVVVLVHCWAKTFTEILRFFVTMTDFYQLKSRDAIICDLCNGSMAT